MARRNSSGSGGGLLENLRNSPETKRLSEEARHLFDAGTGRLTEKLGDGVTGVAKKLTDIGESGSLGFGGEGAKRMLSGDGRMKSAVGAATSGIADKAKGLLGKDGKSGKGGSKSKAMNIEESIDIGVPVSVAYDQWTQFQDFAQFMKGVESVEQTDDTETTWRAKVFKSRRTWKAKIQEQVPDRRIVWTSEGGKGSTKGVVTFHPLADDLTRVLLALEYYPSGVMEKTGNLWRAPGRRARLDLKNFRRFVMMENEATGSWRGEVRDGEVVKGPDEGDDEPRAEDDDAQSDDDGRSDEDEQNSAQDDSEQSQQDDERPRRRRRPAAKGQPRKRTRPAKESAGSADRPRKQARKSPPAKKQASRRAPAKKSSSSGASARKQSSSSSRSPRKQATERAPAKKQASKRPAAKKQASKRPAAKKQASKRPAAKKQASSSRRSPRKQAGKRTARKRSS